jgi:choline dehydrogenase-like flavoprotein
MRHREREIKFNIDFCFPCRTEPDGLSCLAMKNNACSWHRGRVIGGSSTINGMVYIRGSPHDYNEWHRLGNPGENGLLTLLDENGL